MEAEAGLSDSTAKGISNKGISTSAREETEKRRFGTSKQKPLTIDQKEPSMLREEGAFETVFERWAEPSGYSDRRADGKDAPSTRAAEVGDPGGGGGRREPALSRAWGARGDEEAQA